MKSKEEKIIFYSDPNIVRQVTAKVWQGSNGRIYSNEHGARLESCTHTHCNCGEVIGKYYSKCEACVTESANLTFEAFQAVEWDRETPLNVYRDDVYFFDEEQLYEYCSDHGLQVEDLKLVICKPQYAGEIQEDIFEDLLPQETGLKEVYPELAEAIEEVNKLIRKKEKPLSWISTSCRAIVNKQEE